MIGTRLSAILDALCRLTMPLALLIVLLLFLQWPLRDLLGAGSLQANDIAQTLFALYVAVALRHAGARGAHLVARADLAQAATAPRWRRVGAAAGLLPWSLLLLASSAAPAWRALLSLERFPDSLLPLYGLLKLAVPLLAALLLLQALLELAQGWRAPHQG